MSSEKAGKGPFVLIYKSEHYIENSGVPWISPRLWCWDKPLPEGWEVCPVPSVQQYMLRPEPGSK